MDQFKPGVDSAILIFSDYTEASRMFKFPYSTSTPLAAPRVGRGDARSFRYSASGVSGDSEGSCRTSAPCSWRA